jgi:hypothetical protein
MFSSLPAQVSGNVGHSGTDEHVVVLRNHEQNPVQLNGDAKAHAPEMSSIFIWLGT